MSHSSDTSKGLSVQNDGQSKEDPITVAEITSIARKRLPKQVWDYYASGADEEEASVKRNKDAFDRLLLRPRVLRDVSSVDTSVSLFGKKCSIPIGISPSAMQKLAGGNGEVDVARAAARLDTTMILSTMTTSSIEDVIRAPNKTVDFWFQLYISRSRDNCARMIRRAESTHNEIQHDAGYKAIVLTVDTPILGNRLNERKTPLVLPPHLSLANMGRAGKSTSQSQTAKPTMNRILLEARTAEEAKRITLGTHDSLNDSSITWSEALPWLRSQTRLRIILKGIMTAEDAQLAVENGADAIIVSNHGGRQLDGVPSTIEALPEVVEAVRSRIPVMVDGGVTRGSDVFKALALGADFVLIGRAALWGLSFAGQEGVERVLHILERELARTMALVGARSIKDISRDMLGTKRKEGFGVVKL